MNYLERSELVRKLTRHPEVEYTFKHALTQEVAYDSLLVARRKDLHLKVGEALETLFIDHTREWQTLLARHFRLAQAWEKAIPYLIQSGEAAAQLYANGEARLHFTEALEALAYLPDTLENRQREVDITLNLVSVSFISDKPEQNFTRLTKIELLAKGLLDAPEPQGEAGKANQLRLVRVHFWLGRLHYLRNELREAIGYFRQILAVGQETGEEELIAIPSSAIGRALILQGYLSQGAELLARALPLLEKAANWQELIFVESYFGAALAARGEYGAGLVRGKQALSRAQASRNPTATATRPPPNDATFCAGWL